MKLLLLLFLSPALFAAPDLTNSRCPFVDGSPFVLKHGDDYACIGYVVCTEKAKLIKDLAMQDNKYSTFICSIPRSACRNDRLTSRDMIPLITFAKDCGKADSGNFNLEDSPNAPRE